MPLPSVAGLGLDPVTGALDSFFRNFDIVIMSKFLKKESSAPVTGARLGLPQQAFDDLFGHFLHCPHACLHHPIPFFAAFNLNNTF